jgi:hypothetical protein
MTDKLEYKIIDVFGCMHKEAYSFKDAIKKLNSDMYLSDTDIQKAKDSDKYTFVYGFKQCHIERV